MPMAELTMKIKTSSNPRLLEPGVINTMFETLMNRYPQIDGYMYEVIDEDIIVIVYGENLEFVDWTNRDKN